MSRLSCERDKIVPQDDRQSAAERHHLPSSQEVRFAIRDFLADWVTAFQTFAFKTYQWIWRNS
jgi:hypothetical protein